MKYLKFKSLKKGPVVANKTVYDGITFSSGLEAYMYILLRDSGIKFEYEKQSYELLPALIFTNDCVEKRGKSELKNTINKKIANLVYTPDFEGDTFIIETKGRANDSFPLRWKMFKHYMIKVGDKRALYKPQTKQDCETVMEMIKNKQNEKG